jgi:hypothetical protein
VDLGNTAWYCPSMASVVKTVKVPRELAAAMTRVAKARGCSESELMRESIEKIAQGDDGLDMQALIGADIGIGCGPHDLSANRQHLRGYGRSRHR